MNAHGLPPESKQLPTFFAVKRKNMFVPFLTQPWLAITLLISVWSCASVRHTGSPL